MMIVQGTEIRPIATLTVSSVSRSSRQVLRMRTCHSPTHRVPYSLPYTTDEACLNVILKTSSDNTLWLQVASDQEANFRIGAAFDLIPRPQE